MHALMRTKPSTLSILQLVLFAIFLFVGKPFASGTGSETPTSILRFGVHVSDIGTLDPHLAAGSQDRAVADMIFNGLLRYEPGNAPTIEPDLAESIPEFDLIGGRQVWTVRLRKGVLFHAGPKTPAYELTSADVVYSFRKSADKQFCAYAGDYDGMRFVAVDRYTLTIIVENPTSATLFLPKLTNYAGGFIVSKRALEAAGEKVYKTHPVGTGPFCFNGHNPGKKLFLKAHKDYFRGKPRIDGVEIHFAPDIEDREAALRTGKLDVITGSGDKKWFRRITNEPDLIVDTHGVGEVITIYLNTRLKPFDDIRVRRAIALAVNRNGFLETVSRQFSAPVYSPVPADFLPGGLNQSQLEALALPYRQDMSEAKRLLAEAGYPDGFTVDLVSSEKRLYRSCYKEVSQQLAEVGINCRTTTVTHPMMHKRIRNHHLPLVLYVAWRPNADGFLSRFFHSDASVVFGKKPDTNFSCYSKVDRLIEEARLEIDPQKQIQLWQQAQIRILNDAAAIPIMSVKQCYVRRANVRYGHRLVSTMALYPQFTEKTTLTNHRKDANP